MKEDNEQNDKSGEQSPDLFSNESNIAAPRQHTSHMVRVLDSDGKLVSSYEEERKISTRFVDKWGNVIDDESDIDYHPYRTTKIGFGDHDGYSGSHYSYGKNNKKENKWDRFWRNGKTDKSDDYYPAQKSWWKDDYSFYSDTRDKKNEIVISDASGSTIHDANRFIQKKLAKYLKDIGVPMKDKEFFVPEIVKNFICNDVFSMYYASDFTLDTAKGQQKQWFNMLSKLNNYMMKVVTNNNAVNSSIVAFHILKQLIINNKSREETKGPGMPQIDRLSDFLQNGAPDAGRNRKPLNNKMSQQEMMQQAMKEASDEISSRKAMDEMFGTGKDLSSEEDREELIKLLDMQSINIKSLLSFVKGVIKNTKTAAGGAKPYYKEESFMDAEEIEDILDMELIPFHALIEDIHVHDISYNQKFDVFVDTSGSMGSQVTIGTGKEKFSISVLALAKVVYYKMYTKNIIHNVYRFESNVHESNHKSFMTCSPGGGTDITKVIGYINKVSKNPALIISDLCDTIEQYNDNTFILGIEGQLQGSQIDKFVSNGKIKMLQNGTVKTYYEAFPHQKPIVK